MSTVAQVFGQAWKLHQQGSFPQAEQLYRQVLSADPSHADAWCFLGVVCQAQGRVVEAETNLRRAVQILPSHPTACNFLGIVLAQQGKLDQAVNCFQELLRFQPNDAGLHSNLGLVRLQQGRPEEALAQFREALTCQPNHADAYGNMGSALQQLGRLPEAIASFERALQINPNLPSGRDNLNRALQLAGAPPSRPRPEQRGYPMSAAQIHYETAMALVQHRRFSEAEGEFQKALEVEPGHFDAVHNLATVNFMQGQFELAVDRYRRALRLNPSFAGVHYNLALALQKTGNIEEAIGCYRQALVLQPSHLDARNNLGNVFKNLGRIEEAIACYQQVLRLKPDFAEVHANLGIAHGAQHNWDTAIACYRNAIRIKPTYPDAHNSMGIALMELDRLEEAAASCGEALRLNPNFAEAHNTLGNVLERQGKYDDAVESFKRAIHFKPDLAEAHNNMGNTLKRQGKLDEAVGCFQQAVAIKPDYAEAYSNCGNVRVQQCEFAEAQACYDQALRLDAGHTDTHFNQSLLWLLLGKWDQGWAEYEWRWQTKHFPRYAFTQPRWGGPHSLPAGRTVLLLAEQGLGDTLQFVRYAPLIQKQGFKVVLQCQPALKRLLANAPGIDQVVAQDAPLPTFDAYIPLLSLPAIFGTSVGSPAAEVPYLHVDAKLVDHWQKELPKDDFLVGIAWQGNPIFRVDKQRSILLERFARLAKVKGVQLISLQKGPGEEQLRGRGREIGVLDLADRLDGASGPFMDTAAIMKNLDLVISSDTAVPHLAGALGVPVWVALPMVPDWRWLLEREDSPWYPTMRLFRQMRLGKWDDVFDRMAEELERETHQTLKKRE